MASIARFENVTLLDASQGHGREPATVLRDASLDLPEGRYALAGADADCGAVVDLLLRRRDPARGRVGIFTTLSYPIGSVAAFSVPVAGRDMVQFLGRLHRFDADAALSRLASILPAPEILEARLDRASVPDRLALSAALGAMVDVETYVIAGNLVDQRFPDAFIAYLAEAYAEALNGRSVLVAARQAEVAASLADQTLLVANGTLTIRRGVGGTEMSEGAAPRLAGGPEGVADDLIA